MAVNLSKGQKVSLTKDNPSLSNIIVGLGWDTNSYDGPAFDLDASAFGLDASGKCPNTNDFVFFNNLSNANAAVHFARLCGSSEKL